MMGTYYQDNAPRDQAYRAAKQGRVVLLYNKPTTPVRWWAILLGHWYPVSHVSLLYHHPMVKRLVERELTHEGQVILPIYKAADLYDAEGLVILPNTYDARDIRTTFPSSLRMSWRSLLRSGVEHTLPPWSAFLARAILRVFGDDPTPITCSGYVLHLLTGTTDPHELTIPPHVLPLLLSNYYDVPRTNEREV